MGSGSCSCSCPDNDELRPKFFKVFLPDLCSLHMQIPDAFRNRITGNLPNKVILKNCNGKLWPVEVAEMEDGLYFKGGWPSFVLGNSLSIGEFMVFKYNGHHVFDVLILGISGCERDPDVEEEVQDIVEEHIEEQEQEQEQEEKDEGKCRVKLSKMNFTNDDDMSKNLEGNQEEMDITKFVPEKNPSFTWEMTRINFKNLVIPNTLRKGYALKAGDELILQDSKGGKWSVKLHKYQQRHVRIVGGWQSLCRKNKIRKGDTVTFEFFPGTKGSCKTIKVCIKRDL